jgi:hypothetical protein
MTAVALLNETNEALLARSMLKIVEEKLREEERNLTHISMEREGYLKAFSRANVLREVLEAQQQLYRRATMR